MAIQPSFELGCVCMTPGVERLVRDGQLNPLHYLHRHASGDWGNVCAADRQRNDRGVNAEGRLFSAYDVSPLLRLWIITEWDRSATTLLLPSEY